LTNLGCQLIYLALGDSFASFGPCKHVDALFTDTVDWKLIETHWQDLMQVVLSIQSGKVPPAMLLQKLGTKNRRNKLFRAFTKVGRAVRTIFLLDYISTLELRQEIRAATTIVDAYNSFIAWLSFGGDGVIRQRDPVGQEKRIFLAYCGHFSWMGFRIP